MTIREELEEIELKTLSKYASFSRYSKGRDREETPCDIRTCYQRDRDRIIHCKAFRRLKHKTQVFLAPAGDHYRTRLTHTLEVSQIARTIAKALRMNEDLTEAIALGHDLGHTPFGHAGESALNNICKDGFAHFEQSIRVVEILEKKGQGLNLTKEVRDGIVNHRTSGNPSTMEGKIVRLSDKIAYINHDIDDAIRGKILSESDLPVEFTNILGHSKKERLNTMIYDIVNNSLDEPDIIMSVRIESAMKGLREFMFKNVYSNPVAKGEEIKAKRMLTQLYNYYLYHIEEMPEEYIWLINVRKERPERVVCDYIAGMTDQYSVRKFEELFVPSFWKS
ncbi:MAG: deoxyguanosinetriphosphate triphosphohydrolase [Clostridiales bacterium]|jgi:dGTPase|uniref:deoxyguanosinetriphosphate triphosphohydrolase n=1 Tax=Bovifimicola ammoniilytica TaxID=2981720 RepID=UPI00034040EA|nr:deoxyguanosinetriphosphate triphosphohydrolase [Bovifimicola ammoniilytica]MBD8941472.1 deoxyguanosinetriphosphate triphosphohydrolase [Clostridiales bacterium]MCU6753097.1 deoxyguanosinetriphosphate triphosphohydrolase [Bovifimicola ammoniilytica]CCZ05428.1 deoxyguanosinetriphosphate triphosphohydrolase-like protein [Eubacterium sp. CAG:603]SCJ54156.1 Deoxyguanosinetriphosphate triphosphohydrolase [uncultured Eubacterium sp.]